VDDLTRLTTEQLCALWMDEYAAENEWGKAALAEARRRDTERTPLPPSEPEGGFFGDTLPTPEELAAWGDPPPFPTPAQEDASHAD
jgi:hypothetical protein